MPLFVTSVLPFLAHDHASCVAFLTCRHHNFHSSIIPEFLSDETGVLRFCEHRQWNKPFSITMEKDEHRKLHNLFVQTSHMQFSPALCLRQEDCTESIIKPLLETKYFARTLQRCVVHDYLSSDLLHALSKVQSLTKLDLDRCRVKNEEFQIVVNSFPNLETLHIRNAKDLEVPGSKKKYAQQQPAITKALRTLTLEWVNPLFVTRFVSSYHFLNLRKLALHGAFVDESLDLLPLSASLPNLTTLELHHFFLENTKSLGNLMHLSSLEFVAG